MRREYHHKLNKNMSHFKNNLGFLINLEYMAYKSIIESNDISNIASLAESNIHGKHDKKIIKHFKFYFVRKYNIEFTIQFVF